MSLARKRWDNAVDGLIFTANGTRIEEKNYKTKYCSFIAFNVTQRRIVKKNEKRAALGAHREAEGRIAMAAIAIRSGASAHEELYSRHTRFHLGVSYAPEVKRRTSIESRTCDANATVVYSDDRIAKYNSLRTKKRLATENDDSRSCLFQEPSADAARFTFVGF